MSNRTNILINDSGTDLSAERGQRIDRFWFRTEEEARDKLTDLLAARGADWDIRMRRLDDADLERERRIFGAS